jgi:uncharacterized protein (DUF58 family)
MAVATTRNTGAKRIGKAVPGVASKAASQLTPRGWWLLLSVLFLLLCGMLTSHPLLMILGLAFLLWFGAEWILFKLRSQTVDHDVRFERVVEDERGPIATLWFERVFTVRLRLASPRHLPLVRLTDLLPFSVELLDGELQTVGPVSKDRPLEMIYRIRCPVVGAARFEGVRVQLTDYQGFFHHATFVAVPVMYPVLPMLVESDVQTAAIKRHNQLLPPGIHRLKRPGSGSELLDLRDYMTGDPPKTIAWKVSARRDKLITKEFECEVPVRCTLFVDSSNSVRVPARGGKPIHRLIEIAASVVQANSAIRDLTGLCAFDEKGAQFVRPARSGKHLINVLKVLAAAAAQTPILDRIDPDSLLSLGHSFACEVYPKQMDNSINCMPLWQQILDAFPGYPRRRLTSWQRLHHWKRPIFDLSFKYIPAALFIANVALAYYVLNGTLPIDILTHSALALVVIPALSSMSLLFGVLAIGGILLFSGRRLRQATWRKRLAAFLSNRNGLGAGGLAALLEDDDQFALLIQRFLAEHQVPYRLPLYDANGRYLFASPEKVPVLADALLRAVGKGRDNELFVLLVDLLELDDHLEPLLRSLRVALGRHHQVIVICPWPPRMRLPGAAIPPPVRPATPDLGEDFRVFMHQSQRQRFHAAYHRMRRIFGRLGVPLVCAASEEPVSLILNRLDRLRSLRRRR